MRRTITYYRSLNAWFSFFCVYAFSTVLILLLFWKVGITDEEIYNRMGALNFCCIVFVTATFQSTLLIFNETREVFLKEQSNSLYRIPNYFLTMILVELPF